MGRTRSTGEDRSGVDPVKRCGAFCVSTVSGTQPLRRMSAARRIVERSHPDCRKLLRCSFCFNHARSPCAGCLHGWKRALVRVVEYRILIAENRCAAFFVSPVSPDGVAVGAGCRSCHRSRIGKSARSCRQLQNIRLSSAAANPLSRSHNQRADGDGCVGAG